MSEKHNCLEHLFYIGYYLNEQSNMYQCSICSEKYLRDASGNYLRFDNGGE